MTLNIGIIYIIYILKLLPKFLLLGYLEKNSIVLIGKSSYLYSIMLFLKNHTNSIVNMLIDICGVDFPQRLLRFSIVYNCCSIIYCFRLCIKTMVNEDTTIISLNAIFLCCEWWEREVWDMFGIFFINHTRLRRILTDYGFWGYPFRKDFPCVGFNELRYSESSQKTIYEDVDLSTYQRA